MRAIIYVKYVLTHAEYDQGEVENDPVLTKILMPLPEFQPKVITTEEENES